MANRYDELSDRARWFIENLDDLDIAESCASGEAATKRAEDERDGAYRERAHLVAWLAALHPSVIAPAPDVDEPDWQIVYIKAGGWQMSWHVHPRDAELFEDVEHVPADDPRAQWDGHTTDQKYARMRQHVRVIHMNERLGKSTCLVCDGSGRCIACSSALSTVQEQPRA